jgi:hypothetical protein
LSRAIETTSGDAKASPIFGLEWGMILVPAKMMEPFKFEFTKTRNNENHSLIIIYRKKKTKFLLSRNLNYNDREKNFENPEVT